jgi:hypothetical protein
VPRSPQLPDLWQNVAAMRNLQRSMARLRPDLVAASAAGLASVILVLAFLLSAFGAGTRGGAVAAAVAYLVIVASGLYVWRLGVLSRSA